MAGFTVKTVENDAELIAAHELMSLVFRGGVITERIVAALDYIKQRPGFQYDQYHIGILDGEVVAHVVAAPYTLRYGETELTFGGIGGVCTHPDHRLKGYAAAVMRDAVAYMQARGDHLSLLGTGEVNFYTKFGYQTLWSDGVLEIAVDQAVELSNSLRLRTAAAEDVPQMAALYEHRMAERVTMPRSQAMWAWRTAAESDAHPRVVEDANGQLAGYWVGLSGNEQIELAADTDEAAAALLADAARIFQDTGPQELSILVTPDEYLLHRIRRLVACEFRMECIPGANWMARIIDADGFRDAVLPEMARQAGFDARELQLNIQPDKIEISRGTVHVEVEPGAFLQMLFGMLPPAVLPLQPEAVQLLERLCPRRGFIIAPWDWF